MTVGGPWHDPGMLSIKDKMTLDFEAGWWKYGGAKNGAILETFGESPTRYYQRLSVLIDRPDALAYAPLVVRRLQRLRDARRQARRPVDTSTREPISAPSEGS